MAGYKRERAKGVWELAVYVGKDPVTGKRRYRWETFRGGSRAADRRLAELVADAQATTRETVGYLLDQWLRLREAEGLSPTTLRSYRGYIENRIRPALGTIRLDKLTAGDLREFYASLAHAKLKPSSVRQCRAILSSALRFAEEKRWVDRNVALAVRPPKLTRDALVIPTVDEVGALLDACADQAHHGHDLWTCIALAATTGARVGELCALRWSDVDLGANVLRIRESAHVERGARARLKDTKTHQVRTVPLDPTAAGVLRQRYAVQVDRAARAEIELPPDAFILSRMSDGSGPPRPDGYSAAFGRLRAKLGYGHLHLHSLRHWQASALMGSGVDARTVADRLGHSSPSVTLNTYTHVLPGRAEAAAAVIGEHLAGVLTLPELPTPP